MEQNKPPYRYIKISIYIYIDRYIKMKQKQEIKGKVTRIIRVTKISFHHKYENYESYNHRPPL